jgi:hypothetical protein
MAGLALQIRALGSSDIRAALPMFHVKHFGNRAHFRHAQLANQSASTRIREYIAPQTILLGPHQSAPTP